VLGSPSGHGNKWLSPKEMASGGVANPICGLYLSFVIYVQLAPIFHKPGTETCFGRLRDGQVLAWQARTIARDDVYEISGLGFE
jgi:hypothetical protein